MSQSAKGMGIKVSAGGPYLVTGGVPLREARIHPEGPGYTWDPGRVLPQGETYALCRCGLSHDKPFCDGSHHQAGFAGTETANHQPYTERIDIVEGPQLRMGDDGRCAYARFCHGPAGDAWTQVAAAQTPAQVAAATKVIDECPAGRLTRLDPQGAVQEPDLEPLVVVTQDPQNECSAGIYVQGAIPLTDANGQTYPVQNRYVLCRCDDSKNTPFCDASHVNIGFDDGHING